jgi:hypothetical protein
LHGTECRFQEANGAAHCLINQSEPRRSFRIDEDVGDVLGVAHFAGPAPDAEQRIVARAAWRKQKLPNELD